MFLTFKVAQCMQKPAKRICSQLFAIYEELKPNSNSQNICPKSIHLDLVMTVFRLPCLYSVT